VLDWHVVGTQSWNGQAHSTSGVVCSQAAILETLCKDQDSKLAQDFVRWRQRIADAIRQTCLHHHCDKGLSSTATLTASGNGTGSVTRRLPASTHDTCCVHLLPFNPLLGLTTQKISHSGSLRWHLSGGEISGSATTMAFDACTD